jgi:transcriptional regulator with XRE-family HTH domain
VAGSKYLAAEIGLRKLLKDCRNNAGYTQAALAKKLGLPQSFVSKYESGERLLTFTEVIAICDLLGLPVKKAVETAKSAK